MSRAVFFVFGLCLLGCASSEQREIGGSIGTGGNAGMGGVPSGGGAPSNAGSDSTQGGTSPDASMGGAAGAAPDAGTGGSVEPWAPPEVTQHVNPFIGTVGNGAGAHYTDGNVFPGPSLPFGMIQFGPDSSLAPGGYHYQDSRINAFSLMHMSGAGCSNYQDVPVMPVLTAPSSAPQGDNAFVSMIDHAEESARPGYYSVKLLDTGIDVELTTTTRVGFGRFAYPESAATGTVTLNIGGSLTQRPIKHGSLSIDTARSVVSGFVEHGGFCQDNNAYKLYFSAHFDRPIVGTGVWQGGTLTTGGTSATGPTSGAFVTFDTAAQKTVHMKVGVSFVSVQNAELNIEREIPDWDFEGVKAEADDIWNRALGKVFVTSSSAEELTKFYTALYRSLMAPNVFSDVNGEYIGFDDAVRTLPAGRVHYHNFSLWDTYRSQAQLVALLEPARASDMAASLVRNAQQCGDVFPRWSYANQEDGVMSGFPAYPLIAATHAFGARDFDVAEALRIMKKVATTTTDLYCRGILMTPGFLPYQEKGYVPAGTAAWQPASITLEYAVSDFAIAELIRVVEPSDTAGYQKFMARAHNWTNVFDPSDALMRMRLWDTTWAERKPWVEGDPASDGHGFEEGTAGQYTWMVPYAVPELILRMGGKAEAKARLDVHLGTISTYTFEEGIRSPYAYMGNEPSMVAPFIYAWLGEPARAQERIFYVHENLWSTEPDGIPGNDDLGQTSSWYAWTALGMYPAIPAVGGVVLSSPRFPSVTIRLDSGNVIEIAATGSGPYIQGLELDGKASSGLWVSASTLLAGASFAYTLGATPSSFGTGADDAPPSYLEGVPTLPRGTNVALGKAATASDACASSEGAAQAVDGSTGTKWCDNTSANKWLAVDLGAEFSVHRWVVKHAAAGGEGDVWNTKDFSLETSSDGTSWTTVDTVSGNTASITDRSPTSFTARHVRLVVTTPTQNGDPAARIYELEIWAE